VLRKRMEYPKLKRAVREQREAFEVRVVLIEDQASGTRLIQEPVADGLRAMTRYHPQSEKIMRMHAQTRTGVRAPGSSMGFGSTWSPPGAQSSSMEVPDTSRRERRRYWGAKRHQLDFVPSRCPRPRRVSARVLVCSTGGA
jgi:hypothetical protein